MTELCSNIAPAKVYYATNGSTVTKVVHPQTVLTTNNPGVVPVQQTISTSSHLGGNSQGISSPQRIIYVNKQGIVQPNPSPSLVQNGGSQINIRGVVPTVRHGTLYGVEHGTFVQGGVTRMPIIQGIIPQTGNIHGGIIRGGIIRGGSIVNRPVSQGVTIQQNTIHRLPTVYGQSSFSSGVSSNQPMHVVQSIPQQPLSAHQSQASTSDASNEHNIDQIDEPSIDIIISNVVCSFSTRCHLNLKNIAMNGSNVVYKRENGVGNLHLLLIMYYYSPL